LSKEIFIKGKCQVTGCNRKAKFNLYHTVDGVKTWKNVCDQCVLIIGDENEGLLAETWYERNLQ